MELTYGDVVRAVSSMGELLQLRPAPTIGIAVKVARNARKLQVVANDFNDARNAVVETLREQFTQTWEDEDGKEQTGVPESSEAAFEAKATEEINELLLEPVDVDVRVISIADLEACEVKRKDFEVPSGTLFELWFMFGLDEPEDPVVGSIPIAEAA